MLKGGNPLTVGVGIVIEVIRKNNSDYDPEVGAEASALPSSRDPIYLGTLLRLFAQHVPDFMSLILSPMHTVGGGDGPITVQRKELSAAFGANIEPLGFDRFKTCELMAELLHCSNMGLLNEVGSEEFVRARDAERERLKAEGKLSGANEQHMSSDDLAMKSSTQTRLGADSPSEYRRLEVQNASDDDGFEEVTHSGATGDDVKDDFDEKADLEDLLESSKHDVGVSFLDKDDEDFVDEPLTSPGLPSEGGSTAPFTDDSELLPAPLSPKKAAQQKAVPAEVSEGVSQLSLGNTAGNETAKEGYAEADQSSTEKLSDEGLPSTSTKSQESSNQATEVHEKDPEVSAGTSSEHEALPSHVTPDHNMEATGMETQHPEDMPAPLFSGRPDHQSQEQETTVVKDVTSGLEDTTMADAGEGTNSIIYTGTDDARLGDAYAAPVVGDYLKMQFVDHRVVPTILVRT